VAETFKAPDDLAGDVVDGLVCVEGSGGEGDDGRE